MQDFDAVLQEIGEFGRYQQLVMLLLCIPACFMNAYNGYQLVFLMYTPNHRCQLPETLAKNFTLNITATECQISYIFLNNSSTKTVEKCTSWDFDQQYFDSTIITKWSLVCDRAIDSKISLSVIAVATVFGCLGYSYITDHWGRKVAFFINLSTYIIGATVSLFMPSLWSFTAARLLSAINGIASWNINYIWALEYTGPSRRTTVTTVMCVMYGVGMTSLSLIAWLSRTWIHMGLMATLPFLLLFSYHFVIMESPRWLVARGRTEEAIVVIRKMKKWQKNADADFDKLEEILESLLNQPLDPLHASDTQTTVLNGMAPRSRAGSIASLSHDNRDNLSSSSYEKGNLWNLFQRPQICRKTVLVTMAWIANAVVYTSISYNTENLGGNLYWTWAVLAFVEAPGCILILLLNRTGRIFPLSGLMVLSGVCCLLSAISAQWSETLVIAFALIGKLAISVTYGILYQLAGELFPTVVRGLGIGFGSVVGDVGNVMMPYIIYSAKAYKMLPMIIIGILAFVAGLLALFLPETLGQYMPETLEEAEIYGKVGWSTIKGHFARIFKKEQNNPGKSIELN